jgi:tRNA modification GTPase
MSEFELRDTIVALSTPRGKSGLAVVRLSGEHAISIVGSTVSAPERLFVSPGGSSFHTTLFDSSGAPFDDVVLTVFRAPYSYTGEDIVEIATHGSEAIIDVLLARMSSLGSRIAEPGEFSRRAFFNGKLSLEEVELLQSKMNALDFASLRGGSLAIREKFETLKRAYNSVIAVIAQVDAQIDFGESDDVIIYELESSVLSVVDSLEGLLLRSESKLSNRGHFTVAIVGPPNVGKSSLFNALLNFERSIVSAIPGTTRDYLEAFIDLDGHRIKLVDTAGDRVSSETIESEGIERARSFRRSADIALLITDPQSRKAEIRVGEILVHNKVDLDKWAQGIAICSITGQGIEDLRSILLVEVKKIDPMGQAISTAEVSALQLVVATMKNSMLEKDLPLLAERLREAISELATLLGFNVSEDTLNYIFQQMCIGK